MSGFKSTFPKVTTRGVMTKPKIILLFMYKTISVNVPVLANNCGPFSRCFTIHLINTMFLNGLVHPKMKLLSLITHPHVVPNRLFWTQIKVF